MKKDFTAIHCFVDDFIKSLASNFSTITSRKSKPGISNYGTVTLSEGVRNEVSYTEFQACFT